MGYTAVGFELAPLPLDTDRLAVLCVDVGESRRSFAGLGLLLARVFGLVLSRALA